MRTISDEAKNHPIHQTPLEVPIFETCENGNGRFMSRQKMHEIRSSILRKLFLALVQEQPSSCVITG